MGSSDLHFRYKTYDSESGATSVFTVGPISFTTQEIFTSFMSSLLVFPPIILIELMFVKSNPKSRNTPQSPNEASSDDTGFNLNSLNDNNRNLNARGRRYMWRDDSNQQVPKKRRHWPYWCRYIAWTLTALAMAAAAFFTILYSFEFGGDKSTAWLMAFFLAFFESVLLLQPLKVIQLSV